MFEESYLQQLLMKILAQSGVNATALERFPVIVREGINENGEKIRFYLNYSWEEQIVKVPETFEVVLGQAVLKPWDVCIVKG